MRPLLLRIAWRMALALRRERGLASARESPVPHRRSSPTRPWWETCHNAVRLRGNDLLLAGLLGDMLRRHGDADRTGTAKRERAGTVQRELDVLRGVDVEPEAALAE